MTELREEVILSISKRCQGKKIRLFNSSDPVIFLEPGSLEPMENISNRYQWGGKMKKLIFILLLSFSFVLSPLPGLAQKGKALAWWKFDEVKNGRVKDSVSGLEDEISGNFKLVEGVSGQGLKLDGFTTVIKRKPEKAPRLGNGFAVEAWVALAEYPWNWCPVVAQEEEGKKGYYFGLGPRGEVALKMAVNGRWVECVSSEKLPLKTWAHLVGTFDEKEGIKIFINGKLSAELKTQGQFTPAPEQTLVMGMNRSKCLPSDPVRPFATLPAWFSLDAIIDELKIYGQSLNDKEIVAAYQASQPGKAPAIPERRMPSGPAGPGRFGAYYTKLSFYEEWDALWRSGPYSDVVVQFDNSPIRVVFWRGTRYSPVWVMENGLWMADQSAESFTNQEGCFEHMLDAKCLYSHVRIIENSPARVVVHWRYIPVSVYQNYSQVDEITGWPDAIDEYYTFYPDILGVRKIVMWTSGKPLGPQENIVLCHPGQLPEEVVELEAMTLINLKGEAKTHSWAEKLPDLQSGPKDAVIQVINLKSEWKPFEIFEPGCRITVFGIELREGISRFPWWNHWPVAQIPSDGRYAQAPDRASHFSLAWARPPIHKGEGQTYWANWLYGATNRKSPQELALLARSWINPPQLITKNAGLKNEGYDAGQRAYLLSFDQEGIKQPVKIEVRASQHSPVANLCLVLKNAGEKNLLVRLDEKELKRGKDYYLGFNRNLEGIDLILWIYKTSEKPFFIELKPE